MECIILVRKHNGTVTAIMDDDDIMVFPHVDAATDLCAEHIMTRALPFQIVELDEL